MAIIPYENIYRGDLQVVKACRSGEVINKAYRNGGLIYYRMETEAPVPPVPVYSAIPLTFNVLSAGTIVWTAYNTGYGISEKEISYSINSGPWQTITATTAPGTSFNVDAGDVVSFKGTNDAYGDYYGNNNFGSSTAVFEAYGNIMSLIYGDNFLNQTTFPAGSSYNFSNFFRGCTGLSDARNLVLPADTLVIGCYQFMFYNCSSITESPVLPAARPLEDSYNQLFRFCSSLTKITSLATDVSESWCTNYWTDGVAASGTFYKAPNMNSWPTGVDGIPSGWTVEDAQ